MTIKYAVLKETNFGNAHYPVGSILTTGETVTGMIARGILRRYDINKMHQPQADGFDAHRSTHHQHLQMTGLNKKPYQGPSAGLPVGQPDMLYRPEYHDDRSHYDHSKSGYQAIPGLEEPGIIKDILKEHYPQANLNIKKDIADLAVLDAEKTIKQTRTRKAKSSEMSSKATELVEETNATAFEKPVDKTIRKIARKAK